MAEKINQDGMVASTDSAEAMAENISQDCTRLPDEILMEILARLPAKSVARLRTMSHEWSAMLSTAHFIDLHYRLANRSSHPRVLLSPVSAPSGSSDSYIYSWQPGGPVNNLMRDNFPIGYALPITKPCHGLILIECTNYGGYYVCNPSTGAILQIPDSAAPLKMIWRPSVHGQPAPFFYLVCYGLGYCSITKEYKIVRLFCRQNVCICEVLVLDTAAYWRPTAQQPPLCFVSQSKPAVFLNGHLHFLCRGAVIITFDISTETFGSLSPPPGFVDVSPSLTELDGCLCFSYGKPNSDDPYNVFLLRGYTEERWEKLCCIDRLAWPKSERTLLRSRCIAPLGMYHAEDGQKVMFGTGACKVFSVDPIGGAPEILFKPEETVIGCCYDNYCPTLGLFEEYLGPVGRTIKDMVFASPTSKAWWDILKWMPARSVSELSLVCREWRAMIMSDAFIQSHAVHANLNKSPRIMIVADARFGSYKDLKDLIADPDAVDLTPDLVCSQPVHGLNVGSCNSWDFVCNPAMGYCEHIQFDGNDGTFFAGRIGLGYDAEIDRHLLVHITYKEKNFLTRDYQLECKLRHVKDQRDEWYSLDPPPRPVASIPPTYVDGKIYWITEPNLGPVHLSCEIVAFNIETNEFDVLQGPPCSHDNGRMSILQLQGELCVASSDKIMNVIDIWMMRGTTTWIMEYHIELEKFSPEYLSEDTIIMAMDPKDGRILLKSRWSLGYYDLKTAALDTLYRIGMQHHYNNFCPIICDESIVCPLGLQL